MSLIQALFIAIVQGVTELFPVSSLGHAVVLRGEHDAPFGARVAVLLLGRSRVGREHGAANGARELGQCLRHSLGQHPRLHRRRGVIGQ